MHMNALAYFRFFITIKFNLMKMSCVSFYLINYVLHFYLIIFIFYFKDLYLSHKCITFDKMFLFVYNTDWHIYRGASLFCLALRGAS